MKCKLSIRMNILKAKAKNQENEGKETIEKYF